jgi:broad specificity phosphatase PhoE
MTDAMAAGRFPVDEPLSVNGRRQAERLEISGDTRQFAGPEQRTRQTAEQLGLQAAAEPRLADLDCGRWRGQALQSVAGGDLRTWLTDPGRAPHGGESIVELVERVAGWLKSLESQPDDASQVCAVTHPAVVRAAILVALDAPPKSFWRIDVAPLSRTVMHFRDQCWRLRW